MSDCRLCGASHAKPIFTVRGFPIERCPACDFTQVARAPQAQELLAIYNEAYFGHHKYRDLKTLAAENSRRLRLMQRYVPAGARVLEAGCGSGFFLETASGRYTMYGFDLAAPAIAQAQSRNPTFMQRIQQGTLEAPPLFEGQSFDAICLWDAIEHVWEPRQVLSGLFERLNPGGHLFLSTPDIGAITARLMGPRWAFMTPPEHLSFLSQRSMRHLVETSLGQQIVFHASWGKKVNVGFVFYKLHRVMPRLIPQALLRLFERPALANLALYVPTADIQYVVVHKTED